MPPSIEHHIAYITARATRSLERELEEALRPEKIPLSTARVLGLLDDTQGRPMSDLADAVLVDPPTMTKMIDRMVSQSLVFRAPDPDDRRRVLIFMAPRGQELWQRVQPILAAQQARLEAALSPERLDRLTDALNALMQA
ncbi:transcriptional regulator [Tistrella bauzanensis]|uniref:Transcriptional regulator n=1 Tax=Tistrella bauzanensis TaxID=657419 RepID=A0ABQ1J4E6_9PROT|nr:MarR family transcriptional regulator [Tistrella bauzanensis]GGB58537.1 transcriptional regulator [Tistrella bauzanensis]